LLKGLGIIDIDKGIFFEPVLDALLIELKSNGIMTVEVKLGMEREVGRDFQVTGASQESIMEVDVVLFNRFSAIVEAVVGSAGV